MDEEVKGGRCLVVLLHAFNKSRDDLAVAKLVAEDALTGDVKVIRPSLPISNPLSFADPNEIALKVMKRIDSEWAAAEKAGTPFERVILAGHSYGALLARKIYVIACGEHPRALFETAIGPRGEAAWAGAVERIVLLAGMNRGWRISHQMGLLKAIGFSLMVAALRLFTALFSFLGPLRGRQAAILQIQCGAIFLTQLRIQWLWMRRRAAAEPGRPGGALTVQLLGTVDDMVSPQDNIDLVSGGDFLYLDVPMSGHPSVIQMRDRAPGMDGVTTGKLRSQTFTLALSGSEAEIRAKAVIPDDLTSVMEPRRGITEVIFVIHGIRDYGYWTHRIAREIRKQATAAGRAFATETSSYGYFPMLPFLAAFKRREKVQWLMDQYAEAVAFYPDAEKFHFVGHSNGTYCLASALENYPSCHFTNVVLAGSVLPTHFDWAKYSRAAGGADNRDRGSVDRVLNFVATGDWVVAIFPKLFQYFWRSQKLGSAGHDGFRERDNSPVQQISYVHGAHSAALAETNWPAIGRFILTGETPTVPPDLYRPGRSRLIAFMGAIPFLWWLVLIGVFLVGAPWVILALTAGWAEWVRTLLLVAYAFLVIKVLTRL